MKFMFSPSSSIDVQSANTFSNWSVVDLPEMKPNCLDEKKSFFIMCSIITSCILPSSTLHIILVRLTGRQFFSSFLWFFLKIAVIEAFLQASGVILLRGISLKLLSASRLGYRLYRSKLLSGIGQVPVIWISIMT